MSTPQGKQDKIVYFEEHGPTWVTHAETLNVDPALAADLVTKTTAARSAFQLQQSARTAARNATGDCNMAVDAMAHVGSEIIKQIRATAAKDGDSIYTLAGLPIPSDGSPIPPPGAPINMKVNLEADGAVTLKWKANNPPGATGTVYTIWRQFEGQPWENLALAGLKKFTDFSIPAGVNKVTYKIRGVRSTTAGPWTQFVVQFGTNTAGQATATILPTAAPKLAA